MSQFNIAEAESLPPEPVKKAMMGEEVVITRDNKPILKQVLTGTEIIERTPGSAKGKVTCIAPDFDNMLEDFLDYA